MRFVLVKKLARPMRPVNPSDRGVGHDDGVAVEVVGGSRTIGNRIIDRHGLGRKRHLQRNRGRISKMNLTTKN